MASGGGVVKKEGRVGEEDTLNSSQNKSYPLDANDVKAEIEHADPTDEKEEPKKIEASEANDATEGKTNTEKGLRLEKRTDFSTLSCQALINTTCGKANDPTGTTAEPTPCSPAIASGDDEKMLPEGNDVKNTATGDLQNVSVEEQLDKKLDPHPNTGEHQQEDQKLTMAVVADASMKEKSDATQNAHVEIKTTNGDLFSPAPERRATSIVPGPPHTGKGEHVMRREK